MYRLVEEKARETMLDRDLAAILVAAEHHINISRYATKEQRAAIRGSVHGKPSPQPVPPSPAVKRIVRLPEPLALDLTSVSSSELRDILLRDVAELDLARSQGLDKTAKTCIVLCGSITEALLLDRLSSDLTTAAAIASSLPSSLRPKSPTRPDEWDLYDMVNVALHWNPPLLPDDATTGAQQLRRWRNLIHPGRELREARARRIRPTKERANNAIAFLLFIAHELTT
ncbi:MAG: hypothetical protein ACUVV3_10750 [Dehalococcoidia bacterium]